MFNNEPPMSMADKARTGLSWIAFIAQTGSVSVEVLLHRKFGARYLNYQAAAALFLIPVFGMFFQGQNVRPLILFWWIYLFMLMVARLGILFRGKRNLDIHSRYTGEPRLFRLRTPEREITIKQSHEPLVVILFGMFFINLNAALGCYLLFASMCLVIKTRLEAGIDEAMDWDMRDALNEQRQRMDRMREMQNRM